MIARGKFPGLRRFLREELAAEMVESAISASLLFLSLFLILDVSQALYAYHFVADASREGARYAMVRGSSWSVNTATPCQSYSSMACEASSSQIQSFVQNLLPPGLSAANLTVTPTWPGTDAAGGACDTTSGSDSAGCTVAVQVSYSYSFGLPFVPRNTWQLTSSSSMSITQ